MIQNIVRSKYTCTFSSQSFPATKFPPSFFNSVSSKNGIFSHIPTAVSSALVKHVTFLPSTNDFPVDILIGTNPIFKVKDSELSLIKPYVNHMSAIDCIKMPSTYYNKKCIQQAKSSAFNQYFRY